MFSLLAKLPHWGLKFLTCTQMWGFPPFFFFFKSYCLPKYNTPFCLERYYIIFDCTKMHLLWIILVYHNINHSVWQLCSQHDLQLHLLFHQSHISSAVSLYSHSQDQWKQCLDPGLLQHPLWDTASDDNSTSIYFLTFLSGSWTLLLRPPALAWALWAQAFPITGKYAPSN